MLLINIFLFKEEICQKRKKKSKNIKSMKIFLEKSCKNHKRIKRMIKQKNLMLIKLSIG